MNKKAKIYNFKNYTKHECFNCHEKHICIDVFDNYMCSKCYKELQKYKNMVNIIRKGEVKQDEIK